MSADSALLPDRERRARYDSDWPDSDMLLRDSAAGGAQGACAAVRLTVSQSRGTVTSPSVQRVLLRDSRGTREGLGPGEAEDAEVARGDGR